MAALHLSQFPLSSSSPTRTTILPKFSSQIKPNSSNFPQSLLSNRKKHRFIIPLNAIEQNRKETESEVGITPTEPPPSKNSDSSTGSDDDVSELGTEIRKAMKERDEQNGGESFWSGVAEEVKEIEWPAFNKVLGTTGVVVGVIAGSSVVLLTLNAVLAELSDSVFAGRGLQDFFG
ncbi:hypothetical protein LguiA_030922 [Lonicera macranthoides]